MSNYVQVLPIAEVVATALGDGWSASAGNLTYGNSAVVSHTDGRGITLLVRGYVGERGSDRIEVRGVRGDLWEQWPSVEGRSWESRKHEITVSMSKTPAQIARDIVRRLLPAYEAARVEALAAKGRHDEYEGKLDALKACILANIPGAYEPTYGSTREVRFGGSLYGSARVTGDSATFQVDVPVQYVAEFSAFLARMARGE